MKLLRFARWLVRDLAHRFACHDRIAGKVGTGDHVRVFGAERLRAGADVYLDDGAYVHCGGAAWCKGQGEVAIGAGSYVGPHAVLFGMGGIEIGAKVMISPHVVVTSVQHPYRDTSKPMYDQPREYGRVVIEDDVYVGSSAVITPGVRIGRGAVVGAGAVVTHDVPAFAIALGVPARVAGTRAPAAEEPCPA